MPHWEYLFIVCGPGPEAAQLTEADALATLYASFVEVGRQGWELITVMGECAIFKRPAAIHTPALVSFLPLVSVSEPLPSACQHHAN